MRLRHIVVSIPALLLAIGTVAAAVRDHGQHSGGSRAWGFYQLTPPDPALPRVLLIGDSIANGYADNAVAYLKGRSGVDLWITPLHLNSPKLHSELKQVLAKDRYNVIHFNIGLHGWQDGAIPEGQYAPLLKQYLDIFKTESDARRVWAAITPVSVKGQPEKEDQPINALMRERNAIATRLMSEQDVRVNDLWDLMADKMYLMKGDKWHWTPHGSRLMGHQTAWVILQALNTPAAPAREFFVAPDGDDASAGTEKEPFRTIERAQAAVRARLPTLNSQHPTANAQGKTGSLVVTLKGGTYELAKPLHFGPEDSGTAKAPVVYRAAEDEKVVLSGGRRIHAWKNIGDNHWIAEIPEVKAGDWYFRQLFADGKRLTRARFARRGMVSQWLKEPVDAWLASQLPGVGVTTKSLVSKARHDHDVVHATATARPDVALSRLRPRLAIDANAWICPGDGRLYSSIIESPVSSRKKHMPMLGNLSCCPRLSRDEDAS